MSFLVSSSYISQVSGMETKTICKQDSLLFKGIDFETLDDFILSRKVTYKNKMGTNHVYGISLSESEFVKIIIDVCKIVQKRLNEQKDLPDNQKDYCKYVSSQSIRVGIDESNYYIVRIDKPEWSRPKPWVTESTPLFWILNMLKHYLGIDRLPRSQKEQVNYAENYPKDDETFSLLGKFNNLTSLLLKIYCKNSPLKDDKHVPPVWKDENLVKNYGKDVTIPDFIEELKRLL